jgi:hypothetical protein
MRFFTRWLAIALNQGPCFELQQLAMALALFVTLNSQNNVML